MSDTNPLKLALQEAPGDFPKVGQRGDQDLGHVFHHVPDSLPDLMTARLG